MSDSRLRISLAAWSLHKMFFEGAVDQLGMIRMAGDMGFKGFEMVNRFFLSPQFDYLQALKKQSEESGIELVLIMCDGEGHLGDPERQNRLQAARNLRKWVDIADVLGCSAIRVNVHGDQSNPESLKERAAESLRALLEYAEGEVQILLENHGGLSSDPEWVTSLVETVSDPGLGLLPDFGNFPPEVDRYEAVKKMMPQAKAVSAKCYDFSDDGSETEIDFGRMMTIVRESGYEGFVGVEYEGDRLSERDGILAAKALLEKVIES